MRTTTLGRSGITVSAIGLGCMGMSEFYGERDDDASLATLAAAIDAGIDFLDTADMYGDGHNEELLGRFLRRSSARPTIATKFGIVRRSGEQARSIDNSPAYVERACEASLRRLGVETIDLYYCHRRNPDTPVEEMVEAMARLVEKGWVRAIGLSEVSPATLRRADAVHPIAAVQSEYSLWSREPENGMLETCAELGTHFVAYSPLGRAFLTGTVSQPDDFKEGDFRRHNPRFQQDALARNRPLAEALMAFAAERGFSAAQIALAWLLNGHDHVIPIPGTKKPAYIRQNAGAADIVLTSSDLAQLDVMFAAGIAVGGRYSSNGMAGIEAS